MSKITLCLSVVAFTWGFACCTIICPDGGSCSDNETCCLSPHGYKCCPLPHAVCCPDLASCCPSGTVCNLSTRKCVKKDQPWFDVPMAMKKAAEKPSLPVQPMTPIQELEDNHVPDEEQLSVVLDEEQLSAVLDEEQLSVVSDEEQLSVVSDEEQLSAVQCDRYYSCLDGTTCCRHPAGVWYCCPYRFGYCCLDGNHCCPYGYHCDLTYKYCLRNGLRFPFTPKHSLSSVPATRISPQDEDNKKTFIKKQMTPVTEAIGSKKEGAAIRCDSSFYCPKGTSCCQQSEGKWGCCPYKLGQCCSDGIHCCAYGSTCDSTSLSCKINWSQELAEKL